MNSDSQNSCLIIGCGYLGLRVARLWLAENRTVFAMTRNVDRAQSFREIGLRPIIAEITDANSLENIPAARTILFAVGLDRSQDKSIFEVYVEGLRNVLAAVGDAVQRFIYISSTGVYSQTQGEWIDETSPTESIRDGGQACLQAEQLLRDSALADRTVILRLAGIYGPGRVPRRQSIVQRNPIRTDPDGYLNLIHVDDAARSVIAAESIDLLPQTILVSDDHPVLRRDYYQEVARLYNADSPIFETPDKATLQTIRGGTSKRVRNGKMKELLKHELLFPSYREGLRHSVAAGR